MSLATILPHAPLSPVVPPQHRIRIALAGCGTVGGALVDLLHARASALATHRGTTLELARVLVRGSDRPRPATLAEGLITTDVADFLRTSADVVVEVIGGDDVAATIAESALRSGRRLVTANKLLVAQRGPALVRLAREHGGFIDFEAAVGGGIPVVRAIREQLGPGGIRAVRGIVNGTTNFVLDAMSQGSSFAAALGEAQRLGYAEADPARDLSGGDAADKLRILAWLAFGDAPDTIDVATQGVGPELDAVVARARRGGDVVRLVAEVARDGARVRGSVAPRIVPAASPFARVHGAGNLIEVETEWEGTVSWSGPGAGGRATASSVLGDVLRAEAQVSRPGAPA